MRLMYSANATKQEAPSAPSRRASGLVSSAVSGPTAAIVSKRSSSVAHSLPRWNIGTRRWSGVDCSGSAGCQSCR